MGCSGHYPFMHFSEFLEVVAYELGSQLAYLPENACLYFVIFPQLFYSFLPVEKNVIRQ